APVPGTIQEVFPGYHGVAWYWIEFNGLPLDTDQYTCRLHFGGIDYYGEVWLNGQRLGDYEGPDFPAEFDATRALKTGRNLLAVRVINPGNEMIDNFRITEVPHSFKQSDHYAFGGNENSGGLLLPVELRVEPVVRVSDLFCRADPRTGKVVLQLTVENATQQSAACRLAARVERQESGQAVVECQVGAELTARPGVSEFALPLVVPQPKLWSLLEPNLYWAGVRLVSKLPAVQVLDEHRERFGFRDFRVGSDGYFRLNGKRLFLESCHTVNNFPVAIGTAPKPELATRELLYAKAMGFDMVRFLGGPPLPEQLRFCDEIGLMVYSEPRAAWCLSDSPWMAERYDRSLSQMILRNRNHPCVTIWGLLNETPDGPVFRHAVDALPLVRALDNSRLVLLASSRWDGQAQIGSLCNPGHTAWQYRWGDESPNADKAKHGPGWIGPGDVHRYVWWPATQAFRTIGQSCSKPLFLSEFGIGSLVNVVRLARLHEQNHSPTNLEDNVTYHSLANQLKADLKRYGMDQVFTFPEDLLRGSERLQAKHRFLGYNQIRANPKLCGYSLTGIIDQPAGEGLLTEWRELKLGTMDAMNDCLAPLRWCLFVEPMHVYSGRSFRIEAVMANDGVLGSGEYPVRYKIRGPSGIVWEKSGTLVIPSADTADGIPLAVPALSEDIKLNGPSGLYTFAAELEEGGAPRGGRLEFYLSNSQDLPQLNLSVGVLGVSKEVQAWLKAHGVACRTLEQISDDDNAVVLVGDGPGGADRAQVWRELARRMARGSVVLFLKPSAFSQDHDAVKWLPLEKKGECRGSSLWVYHREDVAKNHPIFDGLPPQGIMDPYYYLQVTAPVLFDGQDTPDDVEAAAFGPGDPNNLKSGVITATYHFSAGHFVINTMRILENIGQNPAADHLLLNMVRYADGLVKPSPEPLPANFDQVLKSIGYN
ncbi:MAG: hypothetical protein M1608_14365, partial [Candidatus Omnitrophica bacterium]|nr:hypothetical protein [Candidatus Omnitrophota bacterium]